MKRNVLFTNEAIYVLRNRISEKKQKTFLELLVNSKREELLTITKAFKSAQLIVSAIYGSVHKNKLPLHNIRKCLTTLEAKHLNWIVKIKSAIQSSLKATVNDHLLKKQYRITKLV